MTSITAPATVARSIRPTAVPTVDEAAHHLEEKVLSPEAYREADAQTTKTLLLLGGAAWMVILVFFIAMMVILASSGFTPA